MKIKELLHEMIPPSMQGPGAVMPNYYTASNPQQQAAWNQASTPAGYASMAGQAVRGQPRPTNPYQGLRQQSGSPPVGPAGRGSLNLPQVPHHDLAAPTGVPFARPVGVASSPPPGAGNGFNAIRGGNSPTAIPPGPSAMRPGSLGAGSAQIDSRPERQPGPGTRDILATRDNPTPTTTPAPTAARPSPSGPLSGYKGPLSGYQGPLANYRGPLSPTPPAPTGGMNTARSGTGPTEIPSPGSGSGTQVAASEATDWKMTFRDFLALHEADRRR